MAKVVVQATFDDIVRENIEDLELEPEEAIKDAIDQLHAQGVDLRNIVTDPVITDGSLSWHPILNISQQIQKEFIDGSLNPGIIIPLLNSFNSECLKSIAHRCLVAKDSTIYKTLMEMIKATNPTDELYIRLLRSLATFVNGQPDLITVDAIDLFLKLCKSDIEQHCELGVKLIRQACVMHETNRQRFVGLELIPLLADVLSKQRNNNEIISETCLLLKTLTLDDDPRVPFGKAHDHAKMIVTEANALELLLEIAKDVGDQTVLGDIFATLGRLAVRDEFCQRIVDLGGLDLMVTVMHTNITNKVITTQIVGVFKEIAGNDQVKIAIARSQGLAGVIEAMDYHQKSEALCSNACACLAAVALRNPDNVKAIMTAHGHMAIVQCMKLHPTSKSVQKQACMALRNLVVRSRENCQPIRTLGAEDLINQAMLMEEVTDEAKAALRDLECKVELTERWKGEKGQLQY